MFLFFVVFFFPEKYTLLSKNKPSSQTSTPNLNYTSDLANDGLTETCAQMERLDISYWEVDLEDIYIINYAVIIPPECKCSLKNVATSFILQTDTLYYYVREEK